MERTVISHAASTWTVAHGLHIPLLAMTFAMFSPGYGMFEILGVIIIMALVASLPAIIVFWGVLHIIIDTSLSPKSKLFIWAIAAPFLVGINAFLLALVLSEGEFGREDRGFLIFFGSPSVLSTLIAVLIRSQLFLSLNEYMMQKSAKKQSTDLLS